MDFLETMNEISSLFEGMEINSICIEYEPDLTNYTKQDTENKTFKVEYVYQLGCADYGFYGSVYLPTKYIEKNRGIAYVRVDYRE